MHSQRSQAPAHSASCRRCTQRTAEIQRRQLRHPSETRCQRRCPIISDEIVCTPPPPLGSPLASPTTRYSLSPNRLGPQHTTSSQHCRRSPQHKPSRWHAAYSRGSASSVASSSRDSVPATLPQLLRCDCLHATAAPRLASPSQAPPPATAPRPTTLSPQHTTSSPHCRRSQAPANSPSCRRCTQRTSEVQRRQLRHPSETRCKRRCPSCFDVIACTHRRPSARPSRAPTRYSPAHNRLGPQHASSSRHCRRS
jgi:hypothetical protein